MRSCRSRRRWRTRRRTRRLCQFPLGKPFPPPHLASRGRQSGRPSASPCSPRRKGQSREPVQQMFCTLVQYPRCKCVTDDRKLKNQAMRKMQPAVPARRVWTSSCVSPRPCRRQRREERARTPSSRPPPLERCPTRSRGKTRRRRHRSPHILCTRHSRGRSRGRRTSGPLSAEVEGSWRRGFTLMLG